MPGLLPKLRIRYIVNENALVATDAGLIIPEVAKLVGIDVPPSVPPAVGTVAASQPKISVAELRARFLGHHERVLNSAVNTVSRYSAATNHLVDFAKVQNIQHACQVPASSFVKHLRAIEISPNGHAHSARRKLLDKGIKYILETCRSMYRFGQNHGALPTDMINPFTALRLKSFRVRNAKPHFVFSAAQELTFLNAADAWGFAIHFTLAKTGLRPGELSHLLIEEVDLTEGWIHIRNLPDLGWSIKTGRERCVPMVSELAGLLRSLIGNRKSGPVFLRQRFCRGDIPLLRGDRGALAKAAADRIRQARAGEGVPTRRRNASILASIWRDAGAVPVDAIRTSFIRVAKSTGLSATCPKSWRHTFATLLQEANVDPLIRQEVLGHKPMSADGSVLGMTGVYTHTSPEVLRRQIEAALRLRQQSLELATQNKSDGPHCRRGTANQI